jgi:hypothetical protein
MFSDHFLTIFEKFSICENKLIDAGITFFIPAKALIFSKEIPPIATNGIGEISEISVKVEIPIGLYGDFLVLV